MDGNISVNDVGLQSEQDTGDTGIRACWCRSCSKPEVLPTLFM